MKSTKGEHGKMHIMQRKTLKNCPFCGGKAFKPLTRTDDHGGYDGYTMYGYVSCECGSAMKIDTLTPCKSGEVKRVRQKAITAWNTRAPQWQPIEHCPKTPGKSYDMWSKKYQELVKDVEWLDDLWVCEYWRDAPYCEDYFSHYREIVEIQPPEEKP